MSRRKRRERPERKVLKDKLIETSRKLALMKGLADFEKVNEKNFFV